MHTEETLAGLPSNIEIHPQNGLLPASSRKQRPWPQTSADSLNAFVGLKRINAESFRSKIRLALLQDGKRHNVSQSPTEARAAP